MTWKNVVMCLCEMLFCGWKAMAQFTYQKKSHRSVRDEHLELKREKFHFLLCSKPSSSNEIAQMTPNGLSHCIALRVCLRFNYIMPHKTQQKSAFMMKFKWWTVREEKSNYFHVSYRDFFLIISSNRERVGRFIASWQYEAFGNLLLFIDR